MIVANGKANIIALSFFVSYTDILILFADDQI